MAYETVRYEVHDSIATITLNRPEAYNALNLALGRDLFHATLEADEDRAVRCSRALHDLETSKLNTHVPSFMQQHDKHRSNLCNM